MPARNVGINSTFEQQRQVINALANDVFTGVNIGGIGSDSSINTTGIITASAFYGDGSNLSNIKASEGNTYYVTVDGNNSNPGDSLGSSFLTLKYALSVATSGDTVRIGSGTFTEIFPLTIPVGVTVRGQGLRATFIQPTEATKTNDGFLLNGETTVEDLTIGNFFEPGVGFKFANNSKTTIRSPYIQRVTVLNKGSAVSATDPYGFDTPQNPPTYYKAGRGVLIDGSVVDPTTLEPAMLFNECTFITPNNIALEMTNGARTEWVNCFTYFADKGIYAHDGTVGLGSTGYVRVKTSGLSGSTPQANDELYYLESNAVSGTYSQVGTALTITRVGHGLTVGDRIYADFTSGTATDGFYNVTGYVGINTFSITTVGSATTSGSISYKEALGFGTVKSYNSSSGLSSITGKGEGLFELPSTRLGKTVTAYGGAQLSTSQEKFGTASLLLDGTGDYARCEGGTDLTFSGNFTAECWVYPTSVTGSRHLFALGTETTGRYHFSLESGVVTGNFYGQVSTTFGGSISTNTWTHIALVRSGSTITVYVNGTALGTTETNSSTINNTGQLTIGADNSGANAFVGYIDEVRISNTARYTGNFSTTTSQFNSDGNDKLLLHFDGVTGSTSFIDSSIPSQDIRWVRSGITTATATKIILADYQQFGAEMRSIGSAAVFGNTGVTADGPGSTLRLFAFNFGHIGSGKDFSQDVSLVNQADEVITTNNGKVYSVSIDQSGDFRVGDAFYVNQEAGTVNFGGQDFTLNSLSDLNVTDGTNTSTLTPSTLTVGNIQLSGNEVTTTSGDLIVNPSGISSVTVQGDLTVTGSLNLGYSILGGLDGDKGDITASNNFTTWTIDNNAVNFNKIQNVNTAKVLGRSTAGIGTVEELSTTGTGNVVLATNPSLSDVYITGVTTSTSGFIGNLTGTATTATNLADAANITTGTISTSRLSGTYNIDINGNAATADYSDVAGIATYASTAGVSTALQNVRTFEITGDIIASPISFDGTGNVSLAATIQPNSVALGTDTFGNYVATITDSGSSDIVVNNSGTETALVTLGLTTTGVAAGSYGSASQIPTFTVDSRGRLTAAGSVTVSTGMTVSGDSGSEVINLLTDTLTIAGGTNLTSSALSDTVTINLDPDIALTSINASGVITATNGFSGNLTGNVTGNLTGIASTATDAVKLQTARTIALTGDVVGETIFDGTSNVSIAATIQPNSVGLGTDTTGNYVATIADAGFNDIVVNNSGTETAAVTLGLTTTGVISGSYGSSSTIPTFTVDSRGRLTAAGSVSVSTGMTISGDIGSETINLLSETLTISGGTNVNSLASGDTVTINLDPTISLTGIDAVGIITASQFVTGTLGSAIGISTNTISGPATITIDPAAVGDDTGKVVIKGDLQIDGTTTTINSTTVIITDKNIQIANGAINDAAADNAGFTVNSGDGNKTFQFNDASDAFKSNISLDVASGQVYKINGTEVLSSTTLGAGVINSSLTSLGTLTNLNVSGVTTSSAGFIGNLTGTATTATNLADAANITTGTISTSRLSGTYNIDINGNASTSDYSDVAGIATYATTAGISTVAQGLTGSPNITIGVATASSFVKSGGTSSQFLKADGSTDSNTYLTSYTEIDTLDSVTGRGNTTSNGISIGVLTATQLYGDGSNLTNLLTVREVSSFGGLGITTVNNVKTINFNNGAGFNVTDEGGGTAFVDLGSTFNPWYVDGQGTLKATGEEPIEFIAGPGIAITTKPIASVGIGTTFSKAITITATGGGTSSQWVTTTAGIHTLSNVGIGTTNPTSELTVKGSTSLETLNVSGVVTATSFVKFGGTSSQFLKADGSVDTNTYLSSYTETDTLNSVTGRGNSTSNGISVGVLTATSGNFSGIVTSSGANISGVVTSGTHNVTTGNAYQINGTSVLSSTTLGSGVVNSSLTSVGTLGQLNVSGVSTFQNNVYISNRLGIGVSSPSYPLEVAYSGTDSLISGIFFGGGKISRVGNLGLYGGSQGGTAGGNSIVLGNSDGIILDGGSSYTSGIELKGGGGNIKVTSGSLLVGSATSTGTASQRLQVTGGAYISGSIGVGTTNPNFPLVVRNLTNNNYSTDISGLFVRIANNDSTDTSKPQLNLKRTANISAYQFGQVLANILHVDGSDSVVASVDFVKDSSTGNGILLSPGTGLSGMQFGADNKTLFASTGNVGIGTTNPTSKLHVVGNSRVVGVLTATAFVGDGSNLTGIVTSIIAGSGISIDQSTGAVTITSTGGGGGASVTISDTAPSSPSSGNLWWKSNEGKLKIYYSDGDSSQWVDAFVPLKGNAGTIQIGTVTTGETGVAASVTNSGSPSSAVLNFTLPKGNSGSAATISVGTVTTGSPGSAASVINSGTSSNAVLDFTIPRGSDGNVTTSEAIALAIALG